MSKKEKKTFKEWAQENKGWLIAGGCVAGGAVLYGLLYALGADNETVEELRDNIIDFNKPANLPDVKERKEQHYDMFIRDLHEGWHRSPEKDLKAKELGIDLKPNQTIVDAFDKYVKAEESA